MSVFNSETVIGLVDAGLSLVWNLASKTKVGVAASAQALPGVEVASSDPAIVAAVPGVVPDASAK